MCFKTRLLFDFRALCRPLQLGVICTVFYFIFQPGQDGQHSWNSLAFAPAEFLWRLTSNEPLIFSSYSICFFSGPFHLLNCFLMTNKPSHQYFLEVIFKQFLVQNQFLLRKLFKWRSFTLLLLRTEPFLRKRITSRLEDVRLLWRNLITSIKAWGTSKKGHQY